MQEAQPIIGIRQIDSHLRDVRILQQARVDLSGRLGHQHDANIETRKFGRGSPFEKGDEIHPLVRAGAAFLTGGHQLFREIHNKRDAAPFFLFIGHTKEKPAEQRRETDEIARRTSFVEIGVLDSIVDFEPFKKALLHFARAKGQTITDVVE